MDNILQLGPLVMAGDRLLAVILMTGFVVIIDRLPGRGSRPFVPVGPMALAVGILAARLAFVAAHASSFSGDWWSALAVWQGGFIAWPGFVAAAVIVAWRLPPPTRPQGLATVGMFAALWYVASALLQPEPQPMPDLPTLTRLDGTEVPTEKFRGRPHVVNLWATWCPPCRRELPMLAEAAERAEVPILLLNQGEGADTVRAYLQENAIASDWVFLDKAGELSNRLNSRALPTTLFVDGAGQIVATHMGEISHAALMAQVREIEGDARSKNGR
ncbi:redoxin family protein [Pacificimonas sp. ICDLI1SI03]